jgi:hypothetical protein
MNSRWFRRWGWVYLPVSVVGTVSVILALLFCIQVFMAVDRHSHSASDTLFGIFPYYSCCFLLLNWLGANTIGETVSPDMRATGARPR